MTRLAHSLAGPFALSLGAHALVVLAMAGLARVSWPAPPIPMELLEIKTTPPPTALPPKIEEPPPPRRKAAPVKVASVKQPEAKPAEPKSEAKAKSKDELPKTSDLGALAPQGAYLVVLLRPALLQKSPHREGVDALLGALPDYDSLLSETDLSLFDDFQALLIATSNPRDVTATFLAARYADVERIRPQIESRHLHPGDPRVFRFLEPGLAVLARPDDARLLDTGADAADAGLSWRAQIGKFDEQKDAPALQVTLTSAHFMVRFGGGFPTPTRIELAASGDASPLVHLRAEFATPGDASTMAARWPEVVARFHQDMLLTGLGGALDGLKMQHKGAGIELIGRIPEAQMRIGFAWVTAFLPPRRAHLQDGGTGGARNLPHDRTE